MTCGKQGRRTPPDGSGQTSSQRGESASICVILGSLRRFLSPAWARWSVRSFHRGPTRRAGAGLLRCVPLIPRSLVPPPFSPQNPPNPSPFVFLVPSSGILSLDEPARSRVGTGRAPARGVNLCPRAHVVDSCGANGAVRAPSTGLGAGLARTRPGALAVPPIVG